MDDAGLNSRVIALLHQAQADQQAMIDGLSEQERSAAGTFERWSAKDVVAHCMTWRRMQARRMAALTLGEMPPNFAEFDRINAESYPEQHDRTWDEVLADNQRAVDELTARTQSMPAADLTHAGRFPELGGRPLVTSLVVNGYVHPESHVAQYYLERGDLARATAINEQQAAVLSHFEDMPDLHATAQYNLACFYAATGQKEKVWVPLRAALAERPELEQWARQDNDLEKLRGEPEYQAIFAE
jgi:hypothetical protein